MWKKIYTFHTKYIYIFPQPVEKINSYYKIRGKTVEKSVNLLIFNKFMLKCLTKIIFIYIIIKQWEKKYKLGGVV